MRSLVLLLWILVSACEGGLRVTNVGADTAKPANVRILVAVEADKKPVLGLKPESFQVFEDGVAAGAGEFTVASPDMTSMQYTVLLLDWSGKMTDIESQQMAEGAKALVDKLRAKQKLAVFAFDGNADLYPVVPFAATDQQAASALGTLKDFKPRDATSNLNGAIVAGAKALRTEMGDNLMHGGTLITVYRDGDRASRATQKEIDEMFQKPEFSRLHRFAVGIGEAAKQAHIGPAGATEAVQIESPGVLGLTLAKFGDTIASYGGSYYVVIVCSHARAGEHELRVEVTRSGVDDKGKETSAKGSLSHKFSADGFTAGCEPKIPTELETLTIKPEPTKDDKKDDKKKDDKDDKKKDEKDDKKKDKDKDKDTAK